MRPVHVVSVAVICLLTAPATAQDFDPLATGDLRAGIAAIEEALRANEDPTQASHLRYLIARAHQQAGDCRAALRQLERLESDAPTDDLWRGRARFLRSECLDESGEVPQALDVFLDETERLVDPERRRALVADVMAFARADMTPDEHGVAPNPYRVQMLFGVALSLDPGGEWADEAEHHRARLAGDAATLEARIRRNPDGELACADRAALATLWWDPAMHWYVARNCGAAEAAGAAQALAAMEQSASAIEALEIALAHDLDDARAAALRQALVHQRIAAGDLARARDEVASATTTGGDRDVDGLLSLADAFARAGDPETARALWLEVGGLSSRPAVRDRIRVAWIGTRMAEVEAARRAGDLDGALATLSALEEEEPAEQSRARELAGRLLASAGRVEDAVPMLRSADTDTAWRAAIALMEANGQLEGARSIRAELGMVGRPEALEVAAARTFRSDETPELLVRTDGLGEVELRFHGIDVEDHLRSMGSLADIGGIDVDLIAPESTRTVSLDAPDLDGDGFGPSYGRLPLEGLAPGLHAVEIVGEEQRASALVRVSDIELVTRVTGGDIVVLVVDVARGTPANGARVVVTDGSRVVAEGETDANGLFTTRNAPGRVEVLALGRRGATWATVDGPGPDAAPMREADSEHRAAWAMLDRDEALPGETVRIAGLVAHGQFPRLLPSQISTVTLRAGGELLSQWNATVVDGVLDSSFQLPDDLPDGQYTFTVEGRSLPLRVARIGPRGDVTRVHQPSPGALGDRVTVGASLRGVGDQPRVGVPIRGDLRDGLGDRLLGHTDVDGRLEVPIHLTPGLPAPSARIAGQDFGVRVFEDPGSIEVDLPILRPGVAGAATVRWSGGEDARVLGHLVRLPDPAPETPLVDPGWLPPTVVGTPTAETVGYFEWNLDDGSIEVDLPALAAGEYTLAVQALRRDGFASSAYLPVSIVEPGVVIELSGLEGPSGPNTWLSVEHLSGHDLAVEGPEGLPMLATLEGVGIHKERVVRSGDEWRLDLPPDLVGPATLVLTPVGVAAPEVRPVVRTFEVARTLTVNAVVSSDASPELVVTVNDGAGAPVEAPVFVAMRPSRAPAVNAVVPLFARSVARMFGVSAGSAAWAHRAATNAIDAEVLAWQAEQRFAQMNAAAFDLADEEFRALEIIGGGYGYGASGSVGGAGRVSSRSAGEANFGAVAHAPGATGVDPRHEPLVWWRGRTAADGRATIDLSAAPLSRGWYRVDVVVYESTSVDDRGPILLGDATTATSGAWVDVDSTPTSLAVASTVEGESARHQLVLAEGESVRIDAGRATTARVRVAEPTISEAIRTLLSPDAVVDSDAAFWREQMLTYDALAEVLADEEPHAGRLRRWIATQRAASAGGDLPDRFTGSDWLLRRLETLAEDQVSARAHTLLAVARQVPDNAQARAALMHLSRAPGVETPDVVGAFALATILLGEREDAVALVPTLSSAATSANTLGRALSLEALARLGEPLPIAPSSLLSASSGEPAARRSNGADAVIGAAVRALLFADPAILGGGGELRASTASRSLAAASSGVAEHALAAGDEAVVFTAVGGPVVVDLTLSSAAATGTLEVSVEAVRQGPWFEGEDLLVGDWTTMSATDVATVGRRLRVRGRLPGSAHHDAELVTYAPPGTEYVPGSTTGLSVREADGRRLRLRGGSGRAFTFEVRVVGLGSEPVEWEPSVMRAPDGTLLAVTAPRTFATVSASVESEARLAGQVVEPPGGDDLSQDERLALGAALQARMGDREGLEEERARAALALLRPLLQSADLNQGEVQRTGEAAFRAALALEDDEAIRALFGILESRAPLAPIDESELVQVARTFSRAGDFDYARRAWDAVLNLRFLAEVGAGEQMVDLGLVAEGLRLVHDLTRAYPDIPSVTESLFNLPQMLVQRAEAQPDTPEGRFAARRFRRTADVWLSEYLIRYGEEERAAEAALQQLHVVSELEDWDRIERLGTAFGTRYADTDLVDSFDFMTAYGHQRQGEYGNARGIFTRIVEQPYGERWSGDRDRARLALAQIAHAEGDLEAAIEAYRAVRSAFPDAQSALSVLESPELRVPAVVDAPPGRGLELPLRVRAVDEVDVWAYAVDLERLFLREKQIRAVEDIVLSGIPVELEATFELPMNFGALAEHTVDLDLREPGAYLVLVRSDTTLASTLAVVSDLQLDIVEDPAAASLHVGVTDRTGEPHEGALVRIAHPGAGATQSGETDLRGLVHLAGYNSNAHVLARVGDAYAVYRGGTDDRFAAPSQINTGWAHGAEPGDLLRGQQGRMREMQQDNIQDYESNVFRNRRSMSNFVFE